ncbi:hypothetical protein QBC39DRAFT_126329 [Podospora conica]|nr:hypothetical protein QBC39DRAFT_126329 [Schizothecium conicum]
MSFRKPKTWPYASTSTGRPRGSLPLRALGLRVQVYEAVGEARKIYTDQISIQVVGHINDHASEIRLSVSCVVLSLFMVGKSPERTKPMVMIVSEAKDARLEAFRLVKESGIMDNYPGFDIAHISLKAEFENLRPLGGDLQSSTSQQDIPIVPDGLPFDVFISRAGTSLHGRRLQVPGRGSSQGNSCLATVGGVVEFQGRFYVHSVQHFLPSTTPECTPESAPTALDCNSDEEWDATGMSDFDDEDINDEDTIEATSRGSRTPDSMRSSTSSDFEAVRSSHLGDEARLAVSLVNLDDRIQLPDLVEQSSLPLEPRIDPETTKSTPTLPPEDLISMGYPALISDGYDSAFLHISKVLSTVLDVTQTGLREEAVPLEDFDAYIEASPRDTDIQTVTPNGGIVTGKLCGSSSFLRLPNTLQFQEVYVAKMDVPLAVGDCGGWIRDAATGKIFGHIVAGSPTTGLAMVIPAHKSFTYARDALDRAGPKYDETLSCACTDDLARVSCSVGLGFQNHLGAITLPDDKCDFERTAVQIGGDEPAGRDHDASNIKPETGQESQSSMRQLFNNLKDPEHWAPDSDQDAAVVGFVEHGLKNQWDDKELVALIHDQINTVHQQLELEHLSSIPEMGLNSSSCSSCGGLSRNQFRCELNKPRFKDQSFGQSHKQPSHWNGKEIA